MADGGVRVIRLNGMPKWHIETIIGTAACGRKILGRREESRMDQIESGDLCGTCRNLADEQESRDG